MILGKQSTEKYSVERFFLRFSLHSSRAFENIKKKTVEKQKDFIFRIDTTMMKRGSLIFLLLTLLVQLALTFRPTHISKALKRSRDLPVFLSSTRQDSSTEATVSALEKLLEQQKSELAETERLLEVIRSAATGDRSHISPEILSTAASVAAGFDYGFQSRSDGPVINRTIAAIGGLAYGGPPANLWTIGTTQFWRNWNAMKGEYKDEEDIDLTQRQRDLRHQLDKLTLNSTEIWEREIADGPIVAPWIIKVPYLIVCYMLDVLFEHEYVFARFFLLETVARMPYFSYITMLHLYETLGFWRRSADMKRVHFAEEINEFRHLLIMESLGGDQKWWVRFLAQHSAIAYYVVLCVLWAVSPSLSYRFSEMLETHAVNTYGSFLDENEALLKQLPPSVAAIEYYALGTADSFYAEFQTSALAEGKEVRMESVRCSPIGSPCSHSF